MPTMTLFVPAVVLAACLGLAPDEPKSITGGKIEKPPTIDGTVDPAEWQGAFAGDTFHEQITDKPSKFPTKFYAAYDAENLYFAFIATDSNPSGIRMTEYRRQGNVGADDRILLLINPHGTFQQSEFSQFEANAIGGNVAELAGGRADKVEWQGEWQSVGRRTETGYEVEIRIPWKILYPPAPGKRRLVVNFARVVVREPEISIWSNIGPRDLMEKNAIWHDVEVPAVRSVSAVQALPFVIGKLAEHDSTVKIGADLRYLPTNQITTLATINPDFENIEGALLGVEFSRFERIAEERRPFFVEGSGYFGLGGMSASLFAPQRIGRIDFGAKAFGILPNEWDFGALATTRGGEDNVGMFRLRKGFGRSSVTAGWVTSDRGGIENHAYGIQGNLQTGNYGFFALYNGTEDEQVGDAERIDFDVDYNDGKLFGGFGWQKIDSNFLPRTGFAPRRGFEGYSAFAGYQTRYQTGPINSIFLFSDWADRERLDGKGLFMEGFSLNGGLELRNGIGLDGFYVDFDFFDSSDRFGGASISYPHTDPYHRFGVGYAHGTLAGENYSDLSLFGTWRFPNRLTLSGSSQIVGFAGDDTFQHVLGLSYELTQYQSVVGRAVFREGATNWYLSYRHSGNKGIEYFVIVGDPNADKFQKQLVVKLVAPVSLRI